MNEDLLKRLEREVRFLKRYAIITSVLLVALTSLAFRSQEAVRFEEIEVERINIIEPDGRLSLVIANTERMPGGIFQGEEFIDHREGIAGMIFYNAEETEVGGLTITSKRTDDGGYRASEHLSFDRYNQDQVLAMTYIGRDDYQSAAFKVWDRPASVSIKELVEALRAKETGSAEEKEEAERKLQQAREESAERIFVGSEQRNASVRLYDTANRVRIRMVVDSADVARLEFLDEDGELVLRLPKERP